MSIKSMIVILSIFALSLSLSHCHEGHHHDEHGHGHHSEASGESFVIEATDENFEDIILNNEFVIAKFYAPWCGHCKTMAPEYEAAAKTLNEEKVNVKLVNLDATVHKQQAEKHGVKGFPTLKVFIQGQVMDYTGPRERVGIVKYAKTLSSDTVPELHTIADVEHARTQNTIAAVLFIDKDGQYHSDDILQMVRGLSKEMADVPFFLCRAANVAKHFVLKTQHVGLVLFKDFDNLRSDYEGSLINKFELKEWIQKENMPTVFEFSQKYVEPIFQKKGDTMFLFVNQDKMDPASKSAMGIFKDASHTLKGKILLSWSQVVHDIGEKLGKHLGIQEFMTPCIFVLHHEGERAVKYKLAKEITKENIIALFEEFEQGKATPYFKSEPIPATQHGDVIKVVGDSFKTIVLDQSKDVFVKFYAPWCAHCKQLAPIYEELARDMKLNPNLIIAEVDLTVNDIEGLDVKSYPALIFYPKNNKEGVKYEGARSLMEITFWLKQNVTVKWIDVSTEVDEVDEVLVDPILEVIKEIPKEDL